MELCFLPAIYLGPNYGGGNENNGELPQKSHACMAMLSAPNLAAGYHQPSLCWRLLDTHRQVQDSLLCGHCSFLLGPDALLLCPLRVYFPVLCKFWQLYGGVIGDLLQEGLCQPKYAAPRAPVPVAVYCWPIPPQEMLKHMSFMSFMLNLVLLSP